MPPLPTPPVPVIAMKLGYNPSPTGVQYNHHYLQYTGDPPDAADLATFATAVRAAWVTHLRSFLNSDVALIAVTAQDLSSEDGLFGEDTSNTTGTRAGSLIPASAAALIKLGIARKYRGGKPKIFAPFFTGADMDGPTQFTAASADALTTAYQAFMTEVLALTISGDPFVGQVNISYYKGYGPPRTRSNGHLFYPPAVRDVPVVDPITSLACSVFVGSQRRRIRA